MSEFVTVDDRAFLKGLGEVFDDFTELAWEDQRERAARVFSRAEALAPRGETGEGAASITMNEGGTGKDRFIDVGTALYYMLFQEFGTVHNRAHPFMRPAIAEEADT